MIMPVGKEFSTHKKNIGINLNTEQLNFKPVGEKITHQSERFITLVLKIFHGNLNRKTNIQLALPLANLFISYQCVG